MQEEMNNRLKNLGILNVKLKDMGNIIIQEPKPLSKVYGWTVELRRKSHSSEDWFINYKNKIYGSQNVALDAAIKIINDFRQKGSNANYFHDFKIIPIYKMDDSEYREWKIDQIIDKTESTDNKKIKSWKLKEDVLYYRSEYKSGTIFIELSNGCIITPNESIPSRRVSKSFIHKHINILEEIDIIDEKWVHPHLLKELKLKLK
jgi:hypothetical protein